MVGAARSKPDRVRGLDPENIGQARSALLAAQLTPVSISA